MEYRKQFFPKFSEKAHSDCFILSYVLNASFEEKKTGLRFVKKNLPERPKTEITAGIKTNET